MKYCTKCGAELMDEAVVCPKCGCAVESSKPAPAQTERKMTGLQTAAFVFMILSTIVSAIAIIPLAWCIPMTVSYSKKIKNGEPVSVGFKVCTLLFVSIISGILMLVDSDN
ncbi:MAG: zinc-ribbon domain-containing protein [Clostridia bacterium]|nr:zinc-ribbon domain-containing protein [Clostridia bacterium]